VVGPFHKYVQLIDFVSTFKSFLDNINVYSISVQLWTNMSRLCLLRSIFLTISVDDKRG
jgi:hypothetical protein